YSVVITNGGGSVISSNAILTVIVPPTISVQPQDQTVKAGSSVTFTVSASGSVTLAYQWKLNGTSLPGATTSSFVISNVQTNHAGSYSVSITNNAGSITRFNAILTVTVPLHSRIEKIGLLPDKRVEMNLTGEPGNSYTI